jgi:hypothetical protein
VASPQSLRAYLSAHVSGDGSSAPIPPTGGVESKQTSPLWSAKRRTPPLSEPASGGPLELLGGHSNEYGRAEPGAESSIGAGWSGCSASSSIEADYPCAATSPVCWRQPRFQRQDHPPSTAIRAASEANRVKDVATQPSIQGPRTAQLAQIADCRTSAADKNSVSASPPTRFDLPPSPVAMLQCEEHRSGWLAVDPNWAGVLLLDSSADDM